MLTGPDREPPIPGCLTSIVGLVSWLIIAGLLASAAHGQDAATILARTCISEAGWASSDDCAAIGSVARYQARVRGIDMAAALRALSPRLHARPCTVSRAWLCELDGESRPPSMAATWTRPLPSIGRSRRDSWLATLDLARAILDGTAADPCTGEPHAWGSDADLRRRRLAGYGWTPVDCGRTRNRYGVLTRRR